MFCCNPVFLVLEFKTLHCVPNGHELTVRSGVYIYIYPFFGGFPSLKVNMIRIIMNHSLESYFHPVGTLDIRGKVVRCSHMAHLVIWRDDVPVSFGGSET